MPIYTNYSQQLVATMAAVVLAAACSGEDIYAPVADQALIDSAHIALGGLPPKTDETLRREQAGDIPSIYWDARTQAAGMPASGSHMPWPVASIRLGVSQECETWSKDSVLSAPPGVPINNRREALSVRNNVESLTYRQSLWTPWTWDAQIEVNMAAVQRTKPGSGNDMRDAEVLLAIPLYSDRYDGVSLGVGPTIPMGGSGADWTRSHQVTGAMAVLRGTSLVWHWVIISAEAQGRYAAGAKQQLWSAPGTPDVTADYYGMSAHLGATVKLTREWKVGIAQRWQTDWWRHEEVPGQFESADERILTAPTTVSLSFDLPKYGQHWSLAVSRDALANKDQEGAERPILMALALDYVLR